MRNEEYGQSNDLDEYYGNVAPTENDHIVPDDDSIDDLFDTFYVDNDPNISLSSSNNNLGGVGNNHNNDNYNTDVGIDDDSIGHHRLKPPVISGRSSFTKDSIDNDSHLNTPNSSNDHDSYNNNRTITYNNTLSNTLNNAIHNKSNMMMMYDNTVAESKDGYNLTKTTFLRQSSKSDYITIEGEHDDYKDYNRDINSNNSHTRNNTTSSSTTTNINSNNEYMMSTADMRNNIITEIGTELFNKIYYILKEVAHQDVVVINDATADSRIIIVS